MLDFLTYKFETSLPLRLSLQRLLSGICFSAFSTLWVIYLVAKGFSNSQVGMISTVFVFLLILASAFSSRLLETYRAYKVYLGTSFLIIFAYLLVSLFDMVWVFILTVLCYGILAELNWSSFQILFRQNVTLRDLNKDEGLLYTFVNIGWFIGPLIAGILLSLFKIQVAFYVITIVMAMSFFVFIALHLKHVNTKKMIVHKHTWRNVKDFLRKKRTIMPYIVAMGSSMFFSLIVIYLPLIMLQEGLSTSTVAYFFAITMVPLFLFEYLAGKLAGKYGVKRFFVYGYILLAVMCIMCFFIPNMYYVLGVLLAAHIVMAFNEPLKDAYFFSSIRSYEEEEYYPLFNTHSAFGSLIGRFLCTIAIIFLPLTSVFLVTGCLMAILALISTRI